MIEYDLNKEYNKYKVSFIYGCGAHDSEYVYAESKDEAYDHPLGVEEYEEIEVTNVEIANGI